MTGRDEAVAFLEERGAGQVEHLASDLLTHLFGTEQKARSLGASEPVALAALCHAAYGTDGFAPKLLELDERQALRDAIGDEAEAHVYRYASCDRSATYPHLGAAPMVLADRFTEEVHPLTAPEAEAFALVTAANELDLVDRYDFPEASVQEIHELVTALRPHAPALQSVVLPL
jgi:hypothetical protein